MLWLIEDADRVPFSELSPLLPTLSAARREKAARYRHEPSKRECVLAELLLRRALREEYGLTELPRIAAGENGKPYFPDRPELHFNLSHCRCAVACALDSAPVGVDVQEYRAFGPDGLRLSEPAVFRILSASEHSWVAAGASAEEQDRRFTAVWTCKEAYGKARGCGMLYELKSTEFIPSDGAWRQYGFLFRHCMEEKGCLTLCGTNELPIRRIPARALLGPDGSRESNFEFTEENNHV